MRARYIATAVGLTVVIALLSPWARAQGTFSAPRRISPKTPFTNNCGAQGQYQASAEVEPSLAINPKDPNDIVAFWQQDRATDSSGGSLSNIVRMSRDAGRSWRTVLLPGLSRCTGGPSYRASDPWVSFGGDGTLYASSLVFSAPPLNYLSGIAPDPTAGVVVSTSKNGGASWSDPVIVQTPQHVADKETITADPQRKGAAYVLWWEAAPLTALYFSRTNDGAKTFSAPQTIYIPSQDHGIFPGEISVLHDGSLLATFVDSGNTDRILAVRSTDQGRTWSPPVLVAEPGGGSPSDPETGVGFRAELLPSSAIGPDGSVYIVWAEVYSKASSRVMFTRTTNGGKSFDKPRALAKIHGQAFFPDVSVARDGAVGVIYYDSRKDKPKDKAFSTDLWFSGSRNQGRTWSEQHLAGSFDLRTAPETGKGLIPFVSPGLMIGDYESLVPWNDGFAALFVQARPAATIGRSDMFFAQVASS